MSDIDKIAGYFGVDKEEHAEKLQRIAQVASSAEQLNSLMHKLGDSSNQTPLQQAYEYAKLDAQTPEEV